MIYIELEDIRKILINPFLLLLLINIQGRIGPPAEQGCSPTQNFLFNAKICLSFLFYAQFSLQIKYRQPLSTLI